MKILLVDGLNLIRRVYAGVPGDKSEQAHVEQVIKACSASLRRALNRHQPSHAAVVMEGDGLSWRHVEYPLYKKTRKPMPEDLRLSLRDIISVFRELNVRPIKVNGYEADDVLATLATGVAKRNGHATVLSTDKSLCQLISKHGTGSIEVYDHFNDRELDLDYVQDKFGVIPEKIHDVLALAGDASVNVHGVKGVGVHTASKLIDNHGTLEKVLEAANGMQGVLGAKLRAQTDGALLAHRLLKLSTDVAVGINLKDYRLIFP